MTGPIKLHVIGPIKLHVVKKFFSHKLKLNNFKIYYFRFWNFLPKCYILPFFNFFVCYFIRI